MTVKIQLIEYSNEYLNEWDSFIEHSRNGTFLNSKKFLNYHPPDRFKDSSLLFFKKNSLVSIFPAAIIENNFKKNLDSHPGSTYGGIIINKKVNIKIVNEIIEEIIRYCKRKNISNIIIKPPPKIYHNYPSDEVDFILYKKGFKLKKRNLSTAIFLPNLNKERGKSIENRCKRAIKSAEKQGVYVNESNDLKTFWEILKKNLQTKYKVEPVHTLEEITYLKSLFPERIKLFAAFFNDEMIGGTLTFITSRVIHTQYIGMMYKYQKARPINAVFNYLINYGIREGFDYLNFGVSTESFGEVINWGLFDFKESFGGGGVIHDLYELKII
ncbi:MAG: GNAT family N-acetyltransferase [Promethearchaeia archaeon]